MVTTFLGSVEVVVKEDWDELSEKASVRHHTYCMVKEIHIIQ